MKIAEQSRYIAVPARIIMTLLILLVALLIIQALSYEIIRSLRYVRQSQTSPQTTPQYRPEDKQKLDIAGSAKKFLPDGTLHLIRNTELTLGRTDLPTTTQVFDVNNNLLWQGPDKELPYKYLSWTSISLPNDMLDRRHMPFRQGISPDTWSSLDVPVKIKDHVRQIWRYQPGRETFVGYRSGDEKIGYIGAAGPARTSHQAKPLGSFLSSISYCPADSYSPTLLWQTTRAIYQINFEKQQVECLLESPKADLSQMRIHTWGPYRPDRNQESPIDESDVKNYRPFLYCIGPDDTCHLLMQDPAQTVTLTMPQDWEQWVHNYYRFTATRQDILMIRQWVEYPKPDYNPDDIEAYTQWIRQYRTMTKKNWIELYRIDAHGKLELLNQFGWEMPGRIRYSESSNPIVNFNKRTMEYLSTVSPPCYSLIFRVFQKPLRNMLQDRRNEFFPELLRIISEFFPRKRTLNYLLSLAMAVATLIYLRPRCRSKVTLGLWVIFVALFNLPGLITCLALNHSPTIKCAACGKRRGLNGPDCTQCGVSLPTPKPGKFDLIHTLGQ